MKFNLPRKLRRQKPIFLAGLGLFLIGVLGFVYEALQAQQYQLDNLLSDQVTVVLEASSKQLAGLSEHSVINYLPEWLSVESAETKDLEDWIGERVALIALDDRRYILGAQYRSKGALKDWLDSNLLPGEAFTITETDRGEAWSPAYSSKQAFLITPRWVFAGDSLATLQGAFAQGRSLQETDRYQSAFSKLKSGQDISLYVDLEAYFEDLNLPESLATYGPLVTTLGQTMPALGLVANEQEKEWYVNSQFLLSELMTKSTLATGKIKNTTIPDLSTYAPNDALFFLNGQDLYLRYQHTRAFLKELNPQFDLIFDGLLRAQVRRWFGDDIDFEADFLSKVSGPYGLIVDYDQGLEWAFVTQGKSGDNIEALIKTAQGRFSPQIEEVDLPDGTTREELVAVSPEAVQVKKVVREGFSYSVTKSVSLNKGQLAFAEQGNYFFLASNPDLMESVLNAAQTQSASLSSNNDFRQAVLFRLGKAESFMFVNNDKLKKALLPVQIADVADTEEGEEVDNVWWHEWFELPVRNVILSRRVDPGSVMVKWLFFTN